MASDNQDNNLSDVAAAYSRGYSSQIPFIRQSIPLICNIKAEDFSSKASFSSPVDKSKGPIGAKDEIVDAERVD